MKESHHSQFEFSVLYSLFSGSYPHVPFPRQFAVQHAAADEHAVPGAPQHVPAAPH